MARHELFEGINIVNPSFSDRVKLFIRVTASFGREGRAECPKIWEIIADCESDNGDDEKMHVSEFMAWQE